MRSSERDANAPRHLKGVKHRLTQPGEVKAHKETFSLDGENCRLKLELQSLHQMIALAIDHPEAFSRKSRPDDIQSHLADLKKYLDRGRPWAERDAGYYPPLYYSEEVRKELREQAGRQMGASGIISEALSRYRPGPSDRPARTKGSPNGGPRLEIDYDTDFNNVPRNGKGKPLNHFEVILTPEALKVLNSLDEGTRGSRQVIVRAALRAHLPEMISDAKDALIALLSWGAGQK